MHFATIFNFNCIVMLIFHGPWNFHSTEFAKIVHVTEYVQKCQFLVLKLKQSYKIILKMP